MNKIDRFLIALEQNFGLKIVAIPTLVPQIFSFRASMPFGGRIYDGFGDHELASTAALKSVAELMERITVVQNNLPNSAGVACHFDGSLAKLNAYSELLERDAFMCHWLTKTPGRNFVPDLPGNIGFHALLGYLELQKIEVRFAELETQGQLSTVVCGLFGAQAEKSFGVMLGLGCSADIQTSAFKALIEASSNVPIYLSGKGAKPLSLLEFHKLTKPSPLNHFQLGLGLESCDKVAWLFSQCETIKERTPDPEVEFENVAMPLAFDNCPFQVFRCKSKQAQNLFFGSTKENLVNKERLIKFMGNTNFGFYKHTHMLG